MKEKVTFSIDKKLMEMARNNIPNMSAFVEDCFRAYLTYATETEEERGEELRQSWAEFHRSKRNIHLLMKVDFAYKDIENQIAKQKTEAWLSVWSDYRRVESTQDYKLEQASKTLEISIPELKEVLFDSLYNVKEDMTKLYIYDDWSYIEENILPNIVLDTEDGDLDELLNS